MGLIYIICSPSNKVYVGQTIGTMYKRKLEHKYDAFDENKNHCVALNNAIRKYGYESFIYHKLMSCNNDLLDYYEELYISHYKSQNPSYGYNIKSGGSSATHSEETKIKISNALKDRTVSYETRLAISKGRKTSYLPMYLIELKEKNNDSIIGYRICNHPSGAERKFTNKSISLEIRLEQALKCLEDLNQLNEPIERIKRTIPKYIHKYGVGYCVKIPGTKKKYFVKKTLTPEENYNRALKFYNELQEEAVQRVDVDG